MTTVYLWPDGVTVPNAFAGEFPVGEQLQDAGTAGVLDDNDAVEIALWLNDPTSVDSALFVALNRTSSLGNGTSGGYYLLETGTYNPQNFGTIDVGTTTVWSRVFYDSSAQDDYATWFVTLFDTVQGNALTDRVDLVGQLSGNVGAIATVQHTLTAAGEAHDWSGETYVRLEVTTQKNMSADGNAPSYGFDAYQCEIRDVLTPAVSMTPIPGVLELTGGTPIWESRLSTYTPIPGSLELAGGIPVVTPRIPPPSGVLAITAVAPWVYTGQRIVPLVGAIEVTGGTPVVAAIQTPWFDRPEMVGKSAGVKLPCTIPVDYYWHSGDADQYIDYTNRVSSSLFTGGSYTSDNLIAIGWVQQEDAWDGISLSNSAAQMNGAYTGYFEQSSQPFDLNAIYLTNRDGTGAWLGGKEWCDYSSPNGGRDGQYVVACGIDYVDAATRGDWKYFDVILYNGGNRYTNDFDNVSPIPWYTANEHSNWVGNFYGRDVHTNGARIGYLLGKKVVGADTVPCLYAWTGGTNWDAGTDLLVSADEPVDFDTKIVGWCRADTANRDRYYALFTTENASTGAFLNFRVLAIDLTNIAGATTAIIDNTNYGNNLWELSAEGYGQYYDMQYLDHWAWKSGTSCAEERCEPLTSHGHTFFIFRTHSNADVEQYSFLRLNLGNWLAPTLVSQPANLQTTPPSYVGNGPIQDYQFHGIFYNPQTDGLAAGVLSHSWDLATNAVLTWWSWRDLWDTNAAFNEFHYIYGGSLGEVRTPGDTFWWTNCRAAVRNWGFHYDTNLPASMGYHYHIMEVTDINGATSTGHLIRPWWSVDLWDEQYPYYQRPYRESIDVDVQPVVTATVQALYYPAVPMDVQPTITVGTTVSSGYTLESHYELMGEGDVISVAVDMDLRPEVEVTLAYLQAVNLVVDMDLRDSVVIDVTETVTQLVQTAFNVSYTYQGQSWVDDLIVKVNTLRTIAGLELIKDILYVDSNRLIQNQKGIDAPAIWASDMARTGIQNVADPSFTVGYQDSNERAEQMNPQPTGMVQSIYWSELFTPPSEDGLIIDDLTMPDVDYLWTTSSWDTVLQGLWEWDFGPGQDEIYLQVGVGYGPWSGSTDANVAYFGFVLTNYTAMPYEPFGGGGGPGGGGEETPYTNTKTLHTSYILTGHDYVEEIIEAMNVYRDNSNLPPFLVPDVNFYNKYDKEIATVHNENMFDATELNHESTAFPVGWQLFQQRLDLQGYTGGSEIINFNSNIAIYFDEANPGEFAQGKSILNNYSIATAQEVVDSLYGSPPHRAAMLYDWGGGEPRYAEVGPGWRKFPPGTQFDDTYHGTTIFVTGWLQTTTIVLADAGLYMATKYLNSSWQLDGANIEILNESWDLNTYVNVLVDHEAIYHVRVGADHEANWGGRLAAVHEAPLYYSLRVDHEAPYTLTTVVVADHEAPYRTWETVPVIADHEAPYSVRVAADHEAPYTEFLQTIAIHEAAYGDMTHVTADHEALYTINDSVAAQHEARWFNTVSVINDHEALWDLKVLNPVVTDHTSFYTIVGDGAVETGGGVSLVVNGNSIQIEDAIVSQTEDAPAWFFRARIADSGDFALLNELDAAVLDIQGEQWSLIIRETTVRRRFGELDMRISAESAITNFMSPRAALLDYSNDTPIMASAMVDSIFGEAVDWQTVDWSIPAGKFVVEGSTPYDAALLIIEAAGGIVQSKKDGSILVRPLYPVSTNVMEGSTPDHVLTDIEDNLSADSSFEYRSGENKFRILEGESTFNDTIEWEAEEEEDTQGLLKVFLSPWRSGYTLRYTDFDGPVSIQYLGTVVSEEVEVVEFTEGGGSVGKPIYEIASIRWMSDELVVPPALPTFDIWSTTLTTGTGVNEGYGLAEVTYTTQADHYYVAGVLGNYAQFIIIDGE